MSEGSMNLKFHVGQKVAAICDFPYGFKKGDTATISKIELGMYSAHDGRAELVSLTIFEVPIGKGDAGYDARFFRPVVERKTDISVFTALLNSKPERVPA